jgi:putative flavoprotein involved in K+ transport
MQFPAPPLHLPDKDEVADYLERYAERVDLPIRHNSRVQSVYRIGNRFRIETANECYEADNVVVATGPFQQPRKPRFAADLNGQIQQLHSNEYRNPVDIKD